MGYIRAMTALRPFVLALLAVGLLAGAAAPAARPTPVDNPHLKGRVQELAAARPDGSALRYFVRPPKSASAATAPIVLFLVGSGCNAAFRLKDGQLRDTLYGLVREAAPEAVVATPEKRGVPFGHFNGRGSAIGCPEEFVRHATLEQRRDDAARTLDALRAQGFKGSRVLVIGHSEGAEVAASLAAVRPDVTHVAFLAGGGPSPGVDAAFFARRERVAAGAKPAEVEAAVAEVEREFRAIMLDPASTTRFYSGHAYRYWSSYAKHASAEALVRAKAKLFVAHGSADSHVPIESFDFLVMELVRAGREATVRRIPGAEHDLVPPGVGAASDADPMPIFGEVMAWFARS